MKSDELPIPPDEALRRISKTAARATTPVRPLPKYWRWTEVVLVLIYASSLWACVLYAGALYAVALLPVVLGIEWLHRSYRRCPDCRRRLTPFTEDIYGSSRYRRLFKCPGCSAVWGSGETGDHEADENFP